MGEKNKRRGASKYVRDAVRVFGSDDEPDQPTQEVTVHELEKCRVQNMALPCTANVVERAGKHVLVLTVDGLGLTIPHDDAVMSWLVRSVADFQRVVSGDPEVTAERYTLRERVPA